MNGPCHFCRQTNSPPRVGEGEPHPELHVCKGCWSLLKNPSTALPLLRGHLTLELRGKLGAHELKEMLESWMKVVSSWRPRN